MPPVENPNPDRARRTAALPMTAVVPVVPITQPIVTQPAAVGGALAAAPAAPTAVATQPATGGIFGIMPVRATGLMQSSMPKRHADIARGDPAWKCVEIIDETDPKQPRWKCLGCGQHKSGGATRITNHLLGQSGSAACSRTIGGEAFNQAAAAVEKAQVAKEQQKSRKLAIASSNSAASSAAVVPSPKPSQGQPPLNFFPAARDACDAAIAELFYACNISASVIDHPKFKQMIAMVKTAPPSYVPPERHRLYGALLDQTVERLRTQMVPLQEAITRDCATIMSDGWDTVERDHLINFLYGNASAVFFEGTVQLTSEDAETAAMVAELIRQCMVRVGPPAIVQVVTDTCSVMQVGLPSRAHACPAPPPPSPPASPTPSLPSPSPAHPIPPPLLPLPYLCHRLHGSSFRMSSHGSPPRAVGHT